MIVIASALTAVGIFAQVIGIACSLGYLSLPFNNNLLMAIGSSLCAASAQLMDSTIATGICTACAILHFSLWWNNKGGGNRLKKAARELGEKGKALVQALVDQLTPAPAPSGAGA